MISGIEQLAGFGIYERVNRITRFAALMLAVLWLPVTTHCRIEIASGFKFLACADQAETHTPHRGQGCEGDACSELESGCFKIEENPVIAVPFVLALSPTLLLSDLEVLVPQSVVLHLSPPELPRSWQFVFRTALSPRAPSFVS